MKKAPSRDLAKFVIRLPEGMREQVAQAAAQSGRSMNAEIVYRLAASFPLEELTAKQQEMIEAQKKESRTTEEIIKDLALRLNHLLREVPANEDSPKLTVGEMIDRAKKFKARD